MKNEENTKPEEVMENAEELKDIVESSAAVDNDSEKNKAQEEELSPEEKMQKEIDELKAAVEKEKKEYLFLMAEFDNYRKRTIREKSDIIKNASEQAFKGLLPIVDDFERGLKASEDTEDAKSIRDGLELIHNKLLKYMDQNGVKPMDPANDEFDAEKHEAIASVPAPSDDKKGKILDTVEKGYMINDKVLRHAKVVVAQ